MEKNILKLPWETTKKPVNVVVIGDLILDEYIDGSVQRISPEAPVPVHHVKGSSITAGGAGNVARNVKLAGGQVTLIGVCGCDEAGQRLKDILGNDDIATDFIFADEQRPTTRKTRIRSNNQQLLRVDWEKLTPVNTEIQEKLLNALHQTKPDAIIISDYGKGCVPDRFIRDIINFGQKHQIPTVVDPKGTDFHKYSGCDYMTPNRKEATEPLDLDPLYAHEPLKLATSLREKFKLGNILITLGAEGMYFHPASGGEGTHMPAIAREVYDVSGAGDTVVAIFALSIAAKSDPTTAMQLATVAAGIVVEKLGTRPIYRDELIAGLKSDMDHLSPKDSRQKIVSLLKCVELVHRWHDAGKSVVFTNGCFDILHAGHVTYLERARQLGDRLIVGINTDASVKRLKGEKRPINQEQDRAHLLAALTFVDAVVFFDEDTPLKTITQLRPDILVKGDDYKPDDIVGGDVVIKNGGQVKTVELVEGLSTSLLIERIKKAYLS